MDRLTAEQEARIRRLLPVLRVAHFVDLRVRINSEWRFYEADWFKEVFDAIVEKGADDGR